MPFVPNFCCVFYNGLTMCYGDLKYEEIECPVFSQD